MIAFLLLMSCSGESKDSSIQFCRSATKVLYDPQSTNLLSFPDDFLTSEDTTSPTGLRVDLSEEKAPWTTNLADIFIPILDDISTRSGFARLGGAVIRFSGAIQDGPSPEDSINYDGIQWMDLSTDPPERIAFSTSIGEDRNQLILKPIQPMRGGTQHAIFITNSHTDNQDNCIAPAKNIADIINGNADPMYDGSSERFQFAIEASKIAPETISHLMVFTTHDDLELMTKVADDIREHSYSWNETPDCGEDSYCQGTFISNDYRTNGAIEDSEPIQQWPIKVHTWLPIEFEPPFPSIIYGHGLNTRAESAEAVANIVAPLGIAVFAIDALHHGQHPTADSESSIPALIFLGINLADFAFDTRSLRGSFDQSTADRLQLIQLLLQNPDINQDGVDDINTDQMMYYGISLGGVMGPQLMANSALKAGVLAEGGGDLPIFTTDTSTVDFLDELLEALVGPPDVFDRTLPVLQTGVDSSDPAVWGAHVMKNRLDNNSTPDLLFPVCLVDDTVPPATAIALARGLDIPHMTPILDIVPMLEIQEGPLSNNLPDGATAAYFQFDRITSNGEVVPSNHDNLPNSPEAIWMISRFLETHLDGNTEIKDPYAELGTAPLE